MDQSKYVWYLTTFFVCIMWNSVMLEHTTDPKIVDIIEWMVPENNISTAYTYAPAIDVSQC